jgi:energy-coupling factor transporter transmembrane protein EcfT
MNPFAYEPLDSPLRSMSALPKGVALVCLSAAAFRAGFALLVGLAVVLAALSLALKTGFKGAGPALRGLALLIAISALMRGLLPGDGRFFAAESLPASLTYALRLGIVFIGARMFYLSTRIAELGDSLSLLARRIGSGRGSGSAGHSSAGDEAPRPLFLTDPGTFFTLALLFLPRVFEHFRKTKEAAIMRGYGSRRQKPAATLAYLLAIIFTSIKGALRTAVAMEARGYSTRRTLDPTLFSRSDLPLLASSIVLAFLSLSGL